MNNKNKKNIKKNREMQKTSLLPSLTSLTEYKGYYTRFYIYKKKPAIH